MAYTIVTEIESDFKDTTFTTTSNVKIADVEGFILEADALINAYVGNVYVVPVITAGEGLNLLKLLSRSLVTTRIKRLMEVVQQLSTDANQNVISTLLSPTQVMKILKDIQDGNLTLEGAVPLSIGGGFKSKNVEDCVKPVARKDERQW